MFLAPLYLLLLIPWAAVVVWLLSGAHQRIEVPFLELWSRPVLGPKVKRAFRKPPIALLLAILSMLLAILAASAPLKPGARSVVPTTIIVDRGIRMSANDAGESRRDRLIDEAASVVGTGNQSVKLIFVPGSTELSTASDWAATAKAMPNSAIDTHDLMTVAVAAALCVGDGPVLALSDQQLEQTNDRLIQIAPQTVPKNVSIVRLSAAITPKPEVMLGLRNQSPLTQANVTIICGDQRIQRMVQLKPAETERDFFFDLPLLADTIEASVDAADDLAIDNHAYLVRQRTYPSLEPRTELSPELRRMIAVYAAHRPTSPDSTHVAIWRTRETASTTEPSIQITDDPSKLQPIKDAKIEVSAHPITANVDWPALAADALAAPESASDEWTSIVHAGSNVLVAVREKPSRQVRVSFSSARFAQSADFVIFWANVFDWVGGGGAEEFVAEPVRALGPDWGLETPTPAGNFETPPGIYRRSDGQRRALNAIDVKFDSPPAERAGWPEKFARIAKRQAGGRTLQGGLAIAALAALLLSVLLWGMPGWFRADRPTPFPSRV